MSALTVAICAWNGADRLPGLVDALRRQPCAVPFEILVVDNNSTDKTIAVVQELAQQPGAPLRMVNESNQGIPFARNRAIEESLGHAYMAFIDVDEVPGPRWLQTAVDVLARDKAECVGGRIEVILPADRRPGWLTDSLLPFLGAVDNGPEPVPVADYSKPVWSGNVAYRTSLFTDGLRFDARYNRRGKGIGGGSDAVMFRHLVDHKARIHYHPDMLIEHHVEDWKLRRNYFLRLHYLNGRKRGQFEEAPPGRSIAGVPPYMVIQAIRQTGRALGMFLRHHPERMRQAMNACHACGMIAGRFRLWREGKR